jgi:hypothetical protein
MRWHKKILQAVNLTRGTMLGDRIRVADSGVTRIVGLLGERGLPTGDGLLIVPSQGVHTWGMQFPIDIAVLDDDWSVMATHSNMGPFRMTRMFWKAAAVLELPAGTLDTTFTAVGDRIEFNRAEVAQA